MSTGRREFLRLSVGSEQVEYATARGYRVTLFSHLAPAQWHDHIGEPTRADAICDRLLHNAHRIVQESSWTRGPPAQHENRLPSGRASE